MSNKNITLSEIRVGAERTEVYFPWIKDKRIALVVNQTSMIRDQHLVDSLNNAGINIVKIFSPEHGFRGDRDAGANVYNQVDDRTGIPIISLYGRNNKPKTSDLKNVDVIIFDIQDVGVRFYTYVSTMHYVMEACAENNITFIVLDRPNPNGYYIDGPVMENNYTSFVGLHPVPLVHGLTVAEYAQMINGEGWLRKSIKCNLKYVTVENYNHSSFYIVPVKPSPNLPNINAVYLYPSLGLFEGTIVSVGRGTEWPFQVIGHPDLQNYDFTFTPKAIKGASSYPPFLNRECKGYYLSDILMDSIKEWKMISLHWLKVTYEDLKNKHHYFNSYFNYLAGNSTLKKQIMNGISEEEIRKSWQVDIKNYKEKRKKYILYPDFD
ncbi:exo-beta-N-acetylmuramidase NamZ domain-containing protein [candidate division KSB1 bacterium]